MMVGKKVLLPARLPRIVAHRGASGHAPENTSLSFTLALQMKAEYIELDVQMSRDGVPVVFHDSIVDRTTDQKGKIGDFSASELAGMDAGSWFNLAFPEKARSEYAGVGVPTLQETLDLVKNSAVGLYIELKDPERQPPDFESLVLDLIRLSHFEERVIICSFSRNSLQKIRSLDPTIEVAVLSSDKRDRPIPFACAISSGMLSLRHDLITRSLAAQAHEKSLSIAAWTVNVEEEMNRLIRLGVNSIITNYPDRLSRFLAEGMKG
jgi:glycerophosphoryl diester phosphodiesterase